MYFLGQPHIMKEMQKLLPYLYKTGEGAAILIRGPSGWGKTRMSFMICNYLTGGRFNYSLGDTWVHDPRVKVNFIDEVHLVKTPETLYPLIDSGKFVFILATNDAAILPEALVNRCMEFVFARYNASELRDICTLYLGRSVPDTHLDYIAECAGGNPRIIKGLCRRINIVLHLEPHILDNMPIQTFKNFLEDTFGIKDGLDVLCNRYMEALKSIGGTASLQTLATYLHVDQATLRYYVEPILIYKNLIQISSKGRSICL